MKTVAIVLAVLAVVVLSGFLYLKHRMNNTTDARDLQASIDEEVAKFLKQPQVRGVVVGVYKDGKSFIKGYGTISGAADGTAPDGATVFQIASVSKVFTATLLQILCDEGVVNMDATLDELLGRSMPLSPTVQQVTLRQLATHTSGFPRIPQSLDEKATEAAKGDDVLLDPYSHLGPQYIFDYLATAEDKKDAGRFEYSNYGMGLLGHVLEKVTGKDYESMVKERILAPLEMEGTGVTLSSSMQMHMAQGHTAKGSPTPIWRFAALAGAGALNSNVQDMLKFIQANVDDGKLLSRPFEKMKQPQFGGDTGIGWMQPTFIDKFLGNQQVVWHNGMVGGYASYLSIDAKTKTGVVILTNKALPPDMMGMMLMRKVRTQSWSSDPLSND
ncbi:serine hydrolase domain-containing protein [Zoogloea sp.]|uniref:serine hydrolase domain-containing protein n=1 Tax=Zoogloea sp. TaxID=49181 RepID=UPI001AC4AB03|nr:serine hydrolase domain-containing protein [Zoogloea sp.]MBN8285006.1 beta-lactamase family protein [Zoogloea sp.]